ncbi:unnamed protein product [Ranitomeya imitator]|uniref:Uncharacterized protein n=1 Tax=Ranitomeya imitator TaxID=111125 RepID=A0ABN9LRB4_9NEOB|nr:unnamed protein product [Ranitomeya imitator]
MDTRQLILTHNNLTYLPSMDLNLLIDLVYLDCSHNILGDSLEATFIALPLVYLDLSHNNISKITTGTFYLLTSLVVLNLSDNPNLEEIEKDAFANNTGLRQLDLSRTALTYLDVTTVSELPSLRTLGLSSNPWDCYCPMKDFLKWVTESDIYFTGEPERKGTLLDEEQDEEGEEDDDGDEYLWEEDASQGAIETGGVERVRLDLSMAFKSLAPRHTSLGITSDQTIRIAGKKLGNLSMSDLMRVNSSASGDEAKSFPPACKTTTVGDEATRAMQTTSGRT